jgi:putative transposase
MLLRSNQGRKLQLSEIGKICQRWWEWLPQQYSYVKLGEYVVMPSHLHGIVRMENQDMLADKTYLPLGKIIAAFKTKTTIEINRKNNTPGLQFWQDSFHDRIIRNQDEHNRIIEYIAMNPIRWSEDIENPNL